MALSIDSPQDDIANRKNSVLISWSSETQGQVAYEFMYKLSTSESWSTLGKVNGTAKSAYVDLSSLYDGTLYHYRLAVYYQHNDSVGIDYKITELSPAYSLVLTTNRLGILKIKTGELPADLEQIPLYDEANKSGSKLKVKIEDTKVALGSFNNNGEIDDFQSDFKIKIKTDEAAKRAIREYGNFYYTTIESRAYRANRYSYLYFVPQKWDYAYDHGYYYYELRSYSYISGYHTEYSYTWYENVYDYTSYENKYWYSYTTEDGPAAQHHYYQTAEGYKDGKKYYYSQIVYYYVQHYKTVNVYYTQATDHYKTVSHDVYNNVTDYSYNWKLYQYYEYYYNVYQDHYKYGYDYYGYAYDRRYIAYYYNDLPVYSYLND